jgi:hypothetical protein
MRVQRWLNARPSRMATRSGSLGTAASKHNHTQRQAGDAAHGIASRASTVQRRL